MNVSIFVRIRGVGRELLPIPITHATHPHRHMVGRGHVSGPIAWGLCRWTGSIVKWWGERREEEGGGGGRKEGRMDSLFQLATDVPADEMFPWGFWGRDVHLVGGGVVVVVVAVIDDGRYYQIFGSEMDGGDR